jgi:hypothetical protein
MSLKYRIDIYANEPCYNFILVLSLHVIFFPHLLNNAITHTCYSPYYIEMLLER